MKFNTIRTLTLFGLIALLAAAGACSHEVSHSESDKPDWFDDGRTHTETTVTQNSDGTTSTDHTSQTTK